MNKPHKHAELIKAWADGEKIQYRASQLGDWITVSDPVWNSNTEYRIKPAVEIPEGFTPWRGGECPVDKESIVELFLRDGRYNNNSFRLSAGIFRWNHDNTENDIIAYKVIKSAPVARWQWIVRPNCGSHKGKPELTARFYKDEKEVCRDMGGMWEVISKSEWTRTEFDK